MRPPRERSLPSGSPRRPRFRTAALLALPLVMAGAVVPAAAAQGRQDRVVLPATLPSWAAPSADRGEVAPAAPVTVRVYFAGRDRRGLEALATAVSDPRSLSYGRYLTPAQIKQRFAATPKQVQAVRGWLTGAGFRVLSTTPHFLSVQGDAKSVRQAFGTQLHSYRKDGRTYRAPAAAATVPAAVAPSVLAVTGLDDAPHMAGPASAGVNPRTGAPSGVSATTPTKVPTKVPAGASAVPQTGHDRRDLLPPPEAAFANSGPFSDYFGATPATGTPAAYGKVQPYALRGYTGKQLRHAYGVDNSKLTGAGVTVAIVDAYDSPTIGSDAATYAAAHGDPAYRPGQLSRTGPETWTDTQDPSAAFPNGCGASGWYGEQSLDVEAVHGVAPGADILYAAAASCQDPDLSDALDRIVDGRLADIVSNSWGEPESGSDPSSDPVYDDIFMRGAAEGIGFYAATGDDGDYKAKTGVRETGMPASLPWVTAVGGTSLATAKNGDYSFETGWGTDNAALAKGGRSWVKLPGTFSGGAGGGTSGRVGEPLYQHEIVPSTLARAKGSRHRVVPDVSAVADSGTGFLVGQTETWPDNSVHYGEYRIGGTSLATPVIAAIQALAQQAQGGLPLGFANPALYARYGTPAFHDVTDTPLGANTTLAMVRKDFRNGADAADGIVTTLRTMGHDTSLHAVAGYDDVTGVGTPTGQYLASFRPGFPGFARTHGGVIGAPQR
ncbi:S53 family peptidase [Streptacidiphilus carbonis]|uniref:S53 family peptidase n=1 Tax=Streptacidiphilus carbonis TaxID=105422 RepID=UPI0007C79B29|nr:S53 family peptidase [Streptacidiphilus carbonis]